MVIRKKCDFFCIVLLYCFNKPDFEGKLYEVAAVLLLLSNCYNLPQYELQPTRQWGRFDRDTPCI